MEGWLEDFQHWQSPEEEAVAFTQVFIRDHLQHLSNPTLKELQRAIVKQQVKAILRHPACYKVKEKRQATHSLCVHCNHHSHGHWCKRMKVHGTAS